MTTILLVDDRRDFIEITRSQLERHGFVVLSCDNPNQVQSLCHQEQVDVVMMDMNMPELDGCEATIILKGDSSLAHIPVIMCTAHPGQEDRERAAQAGSEAFLEKPISVETLLQTFESLLKTKVREVELPKATELNSQSTNPVNKACDEEEPTSLPLAVPFVA